MSNLYASLGIDTSKLGCVMLDVDDTGLGDHVTPARLCRECYRERDRIKARARRARARAAA